jgi:hypothetical protein
MVSTPIEDKDTSTYAVVEATSGFRVIVTIAVPVPVAKASVDACAAEAIGPTWFKGA